MDKHVQEKVIWEVPAHQFVQWFMGFEDSAAKLAFQGECATAHILLPFWEIGQPH